MLCDVLKFGTPESGFLPRFLLASLHSNAQGGVRLDISKLSNFGQHLSCDWAIGILEFQCADGLDKMSGHILIVDDEPACLELLGYFLRKEGYEVSEARDGAEAIELIDKSRFDLVLSDVRMPQLDGVALAKHILSTIPTIPIIMMTAVPSELTARLTYDVPCLRKPFLLNELLSNVRRALF